jgi:hypothetical protein
VKLFIERNISSGGLDWTKIFQVQMRKPKAEIVHTWSEFLSSPAGRFPAVVAKVEAAIKADGCYIEKGRGRPTIKIIAGAQE